MNKILIATDLSEQKDIIINEGMILATHLNADVELLTVINKNLDFIPMDTGMNFTNQWEARKYLAENTLQEIKENYPQLNIKISVFIGTPTEDIINQAIKNKSSIIVMGTQGKNDISQIILGSTAEHVIRHSPIPVLIVPLNKYAH